MIKVFNRLSRSHRKPLALQVDKSPFSTRKQDAYSYLKKKSLDEVDEESLMKKRRKSQSTQEFAHACLRKDEEAKNLDKLEKQI